MAEQRKNFVLELTARKTGILIYGKNKYCQTKPVTRNVFTNIILRMTITGFLIGRSQ